MIENNVVNLIVNGALFVMIALIPFAAYRVKQGPTAADRLLAVDSITTLLVGIVILLAVIEQTDTSIDLGIALTSLAFAGTLSIARYISEGRVF